MKSRGAFQTQKEGKLIEVWLGKPDHPESELVCVIDEAWLPDMIAALRAAQEKK